MAGAVLWDMDGTLVDSADYHWQAWRDTMRAEGLELEHHQFIQTFGWRNDAILRQWLGTGLLPDRGRRIADAKEASYRQRVRQGDLQPLAGAEAWVRGLYRDGWLQAIASSAPRANIECILDVLGWRHCFRAVVAEEDVRNGKPDPEVFLVAAAELGTAPANCVVVEDSPAGIEAARRAGMRCIGIRVPGADLVVGKLEDLPRGAFLNLLKS